MNVIPKREAEIFKANFNFDDAPEILAGDTIFSIASLTSSDPALTIDSAVISGARVQARISGGVEGETYEISCIINTNLGARLECYGDVPIL